MISYAQNAEDVVLNRLFAEQRFGRYVDIGASHPEFDSVTKIFYDRGWRGINVEPARTEFALLAEQRPDDLNLALAVADYVGVATLYLGAAEEHGLGSLDPVVAERSLSSRSTGEEVPVTTLARLCAEHVRGPIDFLKIDVEGSEAAVISGADWQNYRPRVLIIEATEPNSTIPSHGRWEPRLVEVGYVCVLFDGLNRFYVDAQDVEARSALGVPANIHDGYIRSDLHRTNRRVEDLAARCEELGRGYSLLRHSKELLAVVSRLEATSGHTPGWYERAWDDESDAFVEDPSGESIDGPTPW